MATTVFADARDKTVLRSHHDRLSSSLEVLRGGKLKEVIRSGGRRWSGEASALEYSLQNCLNETETLLKAYADGHHSTDIRPMPGSDAGRTYRDHVQMLCNITAYHTKNCLDFSRKIMANFNASEKSTNNDLVLYSCETVSGKSGNSARESPGSHEGRNLRDELRQITQDLKTARLGTDKTKSTLGQKLEKGCKVTQEKPSTSASRFEQQAAKDEGALTSRHYPEASRSTRQAHCHGCSSQDSRPAHQQSRQMWQCVGPRWFGGVWVVPGYFYA